MNVHQNALAVSRLNQWGKLEKVYEPKQTLGSELQKS
jgi:hypothetical protein